VACIDKPPRQDYTQVPIYELTLKATRGGKMKYDLIVVGGGPGGLMAAKTAAEDGLKVLLIERKKNITEIDRMCGQWTSISFSVTGEPVKKYGYIEPISLEVGTDKTRVHFPPLGFSINYNGPIRPYLRFVHFSPSGYVIRREKEDRFCGFFWSKEALLAGLLSEAEKAGAEIWTETLALGAENTTDGVKIRAQIKSGEQTLEASRAIAADGIASRIVDSLGLNENRPALRDRGVKLFGYVLEGVETAWRLNSWLEFTVPSLNPTSNISMPMMVGDTNRLGTAMRADISPVEAIDKFMKLPFYEPWFRHARIVKKTATTMGPIRFPIMEPVVGNVMIVGDAAALVEVTNPGAIACGYQAVKAIEKELNGQKGYPEYIKWWQESIETNLPVFLKRPGPRYHDLIPVCSDDEVDYLYSILQGQAGLPPVLVAQNLERIKGERPELYQKLKKAGFK
jgi:flavin-dependent dehydrogenase